MPDAALTTPAQNARSREEWAEIINAEWRKSVEAIFCTADALLAARTDLGQTVFYAMVREDLSLSPSIVGRLISISEDQRLQAMRSTGTPSLPASWGVLRELASLSDKDFEWAKERGLINADTTLGVPRAIRGARNTPEGEAWGANLSPRNLPKPADARQIARETGRMVSASDGNLYSGTTEEEDADYLSRREQTYGVMDAIKTLADVGVTPGDWLDQSKPHWLNRFDVGDLERAVAWLEQLRTDYFQREGVVDGKVN